jgi:hypothetical protein
MIAHLNRLLMTVSLDFINICIGTQLSSSLASVLPISLTGVLYCPRNSNTQASK